MFACLKAKAGHGAAIAFATLLPAFARLHAQAPGCDSVAGLATLHETVADRSTQVPLPGATVSALWRDAAGDRQLHAITDSTGRAQLCAPAGRPIRLRASYMDLNSGTQTALLSAARPTPHTLSIDVPGVYVRGSVVDDATGSPLASVNVRIPHSSLSALTDGQGRFVFLRVPMGDFALRVEHISYAAADREIKVRGEDLDAAIRLSASAIPLQPITVMAFSRRLERSGFYERQKRGVGTFIGRRQIDAANAQSATDLLRSVPGLQVITANPRRNAPRITTRGRGNCRYRFIVDGTRVMPDFEIDNIAPYAIEGIEVYNGMSEVPAAFRAIATPENPATAACGVIVVWTRDSR
ncbi:MAG TPA: carboxypeptidase regulatory-like domain-containing protein [Longimicrobiales bacterium]